MSEIRTPPKAIDDALKKAAVKFTATGLVVVYINDSCSFKFHFVPNPSGALLGLTQMFPDGRAVQLAHVDASLYEYPPRFPPDHPKHMLYFLSDPLPPECMHLAPMDDLIAGSLVRLKDRSSNLPPQLLQMIHAITPLPPLPPPFALPPPALPCVGANAKCCICNENQSSFACIPCGHLSLCLHCSEHLTRTVAAAERHCPSCQNLISSIIRIHAC